MAAPRLDEVEGFVSEALQAWLDERDKDTMLFDTVRPEPPPLYVGGDKIAARASRELGTPEKSRRQLVRRLKRFRYPYVAPHQYAVKIRSGKSFYRHVQSLGLLKFLLEPPFLWEVRKAWLFRSEHELETEQFIEKKTPSGYPWVFHRQMMFAIAGQLARISKIAEKHRVPRKWFEDYYDESLRQLLRETSVAYPEWMHRKIPLTQIRPRSFGVDSQVEMFDAITKELTRRKKTNNRLAYELTALFCSPPSCIRTRILEPNPETVRTSVRDRKKQSRKSTEKSHTIAPK